MTEAKEIVFRQDKKMDNAITIRRTGLKRLDQAAKHRIDEVWLMMDEIDKAKKGILNEHRKKNFKFARKI